jgi:hypothetical protein
MFSCEVCDKVYTAKRNLSAHIKSAHNGVKFTCDIYLKTFTRKHDMFRHQEIAHTVNVQPPTAAPAPPAATPALSTSTPAIDHTANLWDGAICDDELLEIMDDFENQGKKIHYSNIDKILGGYLLNFILYA